MIDIQAVQGRTIALGRLGENNYTRILFDVSGWLADYPSASIGLLNVRPGQTTAYPVSPENLSLSDGVLYWTVTNSDLSAKGTGRCELVAYQGNTIMKSAIFKTMCLEALDGGATPPEPWESWQSFFQALADNAAQSASDAEAAVERYPRIVDGVWEVWDARAGVYVSTGVQAQGPQGIQGEQGIQGPTGQTGPAGAPGISPSITVTDITGGHQVTITDAEHPQGISFDVMNGQDGQGIVQDVQVAGVSVLQDGVANVPAADMDTVGAFKTQRFKGFVYDSNSGFGVDTSLTALDIKAANRAYRFVPIVAQHISTFYGLAKAAGDTTQSQSSNTVGNYTDSAKSAISTMLNGPVSVSGTTPSINAMPGIQYICGEVSTLDITLPASGCVDVVFESGSTPTVLTVTPPTGVTVKWANGFDPTALDANTTYEINIKDGLGVAVGWT